ncbi:hypothetical protein E2C01_040729 [Portunus trituberculatus]|uniref:Uncharacterized protein n=1 Tax=Portunus trituberculatus TaxID=210409 RepID=A0A5B7FNE1_PORTR|nr:hypothetical protein [Portunus trituberculatus]
MAYLQSGLWWDSNLRVDVSPTHALHIIH